MQPHAEVLGVRTSTYGFRRTQFSLYSYLVEKKVLFQETSLSSFRTGSHVSSSRGMGHLLEILQRVGPCECNTPEGQRATRAPHPCVSAGTCLKTAATEQLLFSKTNSGSRHPRSWRKVVQARQVAVVSMTSKRSVIYSNLSSLLYPFRGCKTQFPTTGTGWWRTPVHRGRTARLTPWY